MHQVFLFQIPREVVRKIVTRWTKFLNWLFDSRSNCFSVMTELAIKDYLEIVAAAHDKRGMIAGQREVLKTTSAKRIRDRMVADLLKGAVLPAPVLGITVASKYFKSLPDIKATSLTDILEKGGASEISIIDGMQRTQAIIEAEATGELDSSKTMRVEIWVSSAVRPLIYRMLILNSGQIPWTLSRQLAIVFEPLLNEIRKNVPSISRVLTPDIGGRRVAAAEYKSEDLIELYIAFSLRKTAVDTKEALSDEFSKLDFVENLSDENFQNQFYNSLEILANLDLRISRMESDTGERFKKGRNLFDSQPARIGLVVAIALYVIGRPGMDREAGDREVRMMELKEKADKFIEKLGKFKEGDLETYLAFPVLEEILDRRVGQVGRYERSVFLEAFNVLVQEDFKVPSMEPCWRAG